MLNSSQQAGELVTGQGIMFGHKRSISVFASKARSWLITLCQISTDKQITNLISRCKIAKNWGLSPSTIHNTVKRFRESRDITVHVGRGRKAQLNVLDLWALRWHCIRNRHAAVLNIATWAQEYFRKPLSFTTVCCCIRKCNLNLCYSRRKLYINSMQRCCRVLWARAHLR